MEFKGFKILDGDKKIMISAPHAVEQTREGRIKFAEKETAIIAESLNKQGYPVIIKTENLGDDANYDAVSPYKDEMIAYCKEKKIEFVIDLHQLSDARPMDFCLCTGGISNSNLLGHDGILDKLKEYAKDHYFYVEINNPYSAVKDTNISKNCANHYIPALQIEINNKLVLNYTENVNFNFAYDFVSYACEAVEEEMSNENNINKQCEFQLGEN